MVAGVFAERQPDRAPHGAHGRAPQRCDRSEFRPAPDRGRQRALVRPGARLGEPDGGQRPDLLRHLAASCRSPRPTSPSWWPWARSLSDQAWGRESAVYRVTGVLTVIGGWFFTAMMAFSVSSASSPPRSSSARPRPCWPSLVLGGVHFWCAPACVHKPREQDEQPPRSSTCARSRTPPRRSTSPSSTPGSSSREVRQDPGHGLRGVCDDDRIATLLRAAKSAASRQIQQLVQHHRGQHLQGPAAAAVGGGGRHPALRADDQQPAGDQRERARHRRARPTSTWPTTTPACWRRRSPRCEQVRQALVRRSSNRPPRPCCATGSPRGRRRSSATTTASCACWSTSTTRTRSCASRTTRPRPG